MEIVLDLLQAAGIGAAVGIRPFLPALLVGALAAGDLGVDFDRTDLSFLEEAPFLLVMLVGLVAFDLVRRRAGEDRLDTGPGRTVVAVVAVVVAGLLGAGSLADRDHPVVAGVVAAVACAVLAIIAVPPLALVVVVGLAFLLTGGKRRQGEKYAGLRILR